LERVSESVGGWLSLNWLWEEVEDAASLGLSPGDGVALVPDGQVLLLSVDVEADPDLLGQRDGLGLPGRVLLDGELGVQVLSVFELQTVEHGSGRQVAGGALGLVRFDVELVLRAFNALDDPPLATETIVSVPGGDLSCASVSGGEEFLLAVPSEGLDVEGVGCVSSLDQLPAGQSLCVQVSVHVGVVVRADGGCHDFVLAVGLHTRSDLDMFGEVDGSGGGPGLQHDVVVLVHGVFKVHFIGSRSVGMTKGLLGTAVSSLVRDLVRAIAIALEVPP